MYSFYINSNSDSYVVRMNNRTFLTAIRHRKIFGDRVVFFDSEGVELARVKQFYFLIINFGFKIDFLGRYKSAKIYKKRLTTFNIEVESDKFSFQYSVFGKCSELYVNDKPVGSFKIHNENNSGYLHEIVCNSEKEGLAFCILDIVEDWFYFN